MKTIEEIEDAIKKLPPPEVEQLVGWLESLKPNGRSTSVETWLQKARGAAVPGVTTANIMAQTRGE